MNLSAIFFDGWASLVRTLVIGLLAYPGMLIILRLSGHRTLAKLNAFDLVVTVALGSTLATVLLTKDVSLAQGLLAFALLVSMQFVLAWLTIRSNRIESWINGQPVLLMHGGTMLRESLERARVTEDEVRAALRSQGHTEIDVHAVVLETNGQLSVLFRGNAQHMPTLANVRMGHDDKAAHKA